MATGYIFQDLSVSICIFKLNVVRSFLNIFTASSGVNLPIDMPICLVRIGLDFISLFYKLPPLKEASHSSDPLVSPSSPQNPPG